MWSKMKNREDKIYYSQCWEDPLLVYEALAIDSQDTVLSITSGGDNSLALLLKNPQRVISIDLNVLQNHVLEFKIAAIQALEYEDVLELLGVRKSARREQLFEMATKYMSPEAVSWWGKHTSFIKEGIIHGGRFERFLHVFSQHILPLIHSRNTVETFLGSPSLQSQKGFYQQTWNSPRWRLFFRIITSRFVLRTFARQRGMFVHTEPGAIAQEYLRRLDQNFNTVPLKDNYFMRYCLTGNFGTQVPQYLERKGVESLKANLSRLSIVTNDLRGYLKGMPDEFQRKPSFLRKQKR